MRVVKNSFSWPGYMSPARIIFMQDVVNFATGVQVYMDLTR